MNSFLDKFLEGEELKKVVEEPEEEKLSDWVERFVADCLELDDKSRVKSTDMRLIYEDWAEATWTPEVGRVEMGRELQKLIKRKRGSQGLIYIGVREKNVLI